MEFRTSLRGAVSPWGALRAPAQEITEAISASLANLRREDIGWAQIGENYTSDVVPLKAIKDHSVRARRLAALNPLVKRGIGIRNAYMWESLPEANLSESAMRLFGDDLLSLEARSRDESAFATDGMVLYLVTPTTQAVRPVPLHRVVDVARVETALGEGDISAVLVSPLPTKAWDAKIDDRKPVWYPTPRYASAPVVQDPRGYRTDMSTLALVEFVNRQVGEEWGKPDLMGAVYWAQAYKEHLEAAYTMSKALARIAYKISSMNKPQQMAVHAQMSGTTNSYGGAASLGQGQDLQVVNKSGAGIDFSAGTPLAAMVSAALDVPLSVLLTDGSAGGRQGAETALEEPTFKAFEARRAIHLRLLRRIFDALGRTEEIRLRPLSTELVQRWSQAVALGVQNGLLHQVEARQLFLDRFHPENAKAVDDLPETPEEKAAAATGPEDGRSTGVGPLSDGTNANRDEDGGETIA